MFFLILASVVGILAADRNGSRSIYSSKNQIEKNSLFSEKFEKLVKLSVDQFSSVQSLSHVRFFATP